MFFGVEDNKGYNYFFRMIYLLPKEKKELLGDSFLIDSHSPPSSF